MALQVINRGASPGDGTGDTGYVGAGKINDNFAYIAGLTQVSYSVLTFGATGIGADDTTAIQSADNAATAAGKALYFPSGTYGININGITRGGCSWFGDGPYVSVLKALANSYSVANTGLVTCNSHSNWTAYNLGFDVTAASFAIASPGVAHFTGSMVGTVLTVTAVADGAIAFNGTMKVSGINVAAAPTIVSAGTGAGGTGTYNLSTSQSAVSTAMLGSPVSGTFYYIFRAQACNNFAIRNCNFSGIQPYVLAASIVAGATGAINWSIADCVFTMNSPSPLPNQAINISVAGGGLNDNWMVARNFFMGSGVFSNATNGTMISNRAVGVAYGAGLASGLAGTDNHAYIDNDCLNCTGVDANSVRVSGIESYSKDSRIIGNRCYNNAAYGIKFGGDNAVVIGNICKNNGQIGAADTSTNYGGITALTPAVVTPGLAASNAIVAFNNCYDDQGTATQEYGYSEKIVAGTISGNLLGPNRFAGNLLGDYSLAGATPYVATTSGAILSNPTTVASLPAAAAANKGASTFVTDATATTFASIVAGGGANNVPVYSDGTNWRIG
jgi:hypothetical protein